MKDKRKTMKKILDTSLFSSFLCFSPFSKIYSFHPLLPNSSLYIPWHHSLPSHTTFVSKISYAMLQQKLILYMILILLQITTGAVGVKVNKVRVPQPGIVGQPAKLECFWDAGDMDIYSVKWYLNNDEFYRFMPANTPQKLTFKLPGVNVVLSNSDQNVLTLTELTPAAEGLYRCEVMSDWPFFHVSIASANLTVVTLPGDPDIQGVKDRHRIGDTLNATCTARDARPPATLSFQVNGRNVQPDSGRVRELGVFEGFQRGLYTSSSQLILPLLSHHAPILTITCRSDVLSIQQETSLTTQVDPADTTVLFNTGVPCSSPSSQAFLMASVALLLLFLMAPVALLPGNPSPMANI